MRKEQIAVIALAAWLTVITVFMLVAQTFDIGIFFVLSIIGFLITQKLITPKYIQPGYTRYIRYILAAGIVIFGVIVALKVMEILGLEIGFS
jgi:Ni,Fe-hydrogenase I cytochrome b subunit